MKKFVIGASLILAMAATPALAKSRAQVTADQAYAASTANEPVTADESGLTTRGPAVISFDQYRGWDPDPNIRFQLLRDPNLAP
jgi:hypothetical protein